MTILARPSEWARAEKDRASARSSADGSEHYFAFLSYSHRDRDTAEWLHDALEGFRVPSHLVGRLTEHGSIPRRLTPIFRDLSELPASDDLGEEIRDALAASRFLIVLCSPAAAQSRWTNAEVGTFKALQPDGTILAAVIEGEPFATAIAGREHEECFPQALRFKYDRRGRPTQIPAEPLAADLRGDAETRRLGFLKLVAGMLGVRLDDLIRRDEIRRQRKLAVLAAASLAGMIIASGLAFTAIQARDAARDQRREAEGLVAFMLGDLKDKLEPIGKLDALDGVGSRVLAYYEKQDASELSDAALLQRSRALSLTAQVAYLRLDLRTAEQLYGQAFQGTAEAVRRSPKDPQRLWDHMQNVFSLGELARDNGRMKQAEAAYREYKRLADQLVAIEPDNLKWRMEVAYGNENIEIVLFNQRRFAESASQFDGSVGTIKSLASIDARNEEYQKELSTVLAWQADAARAQGRLDVATAIRERQIALLSQLAGKKEADVDFREQLIPAYQALGMLLTSKGQVEQGIEQLRLAVAVADRLIPVEPDNAYWKGLAAQAGLELAQTLLLANRTTEAVAEARTACDYAAVVSARDQSTTWRQLQTNCSATQAGLALRSGDTAGALKLAEGAVASARTARSEDPIKDRYSIASQLRLLGDVRRRMGDGKGARSNWASGLSQLPADASERPSETNVRAELLQRLGRVDEARALKSRLAAIGYRVQPEGRE